jgi:UDP-N-acetylglucosamine 2-epimerase (non-hydrolysing)
MIDLVAGTRPNFMKVAPVWRALQERSVRTRLIHTGQHFDEMMSDVFFRDLGLPAPDVRLSCGGGTHAQQTASVLVNVERVLQDSPSSAVVVVGDVTSTLAAALAAAKLGVPVVHVEAGLRSGDWTMPEEINRVVTDRISDLLLTPSADAGDNLVREGIAAERIRFVGNVMIDSLKWALRHPTDAVRRLKLEVGAYALATLHRPGNVDSAASLQATLDALTLAARRLPVLFPVHPRTLARATELGLLDVLTSTPGLQATGPIGYNDFVTLMASAKLVLTDSGGIQEETTALGIPCLTLRHGTERPLTVTMGTNVVVGLDLARITQEIDLVLAGRAKRGTVPDGWDGKAAGRIAEAIERLLAGDPPPRTAGPRA